MNHKADKTENWQCMTTITIYPKGEAELVELPFPKYFPTQEEATEFGKRMFEPPQTVMAWRIITVTKP